MQKYSKIVVQLGHLDTTSYPLPDNTVPKGYRTRIMVDKTYNEVYCYCLTEDIGYWRPKVEDKAYTVLTKQRIEMDKKLDILSTRLLEHELSDTHGYTLKQYRKMCKDMAKKDKQS